MRTLYIFGLLLMQQFFFSQVFIGATTANNKNIIKILDGSKGVILTSANAYTSFPKYVSTDKDLFSDYANLNGSVIYNKDDDQYYKYDGYSWNPSRQLQGIFHKKASRLGVSSGLSIPCISFGIGFCFSTSVPTFLKADDRNEILIDHLGLKNSSTFTVKQSGLYDVGVSLGFSGGSFGFQAGLTEFKITLQAKYPLSSEWQSIVSKTNYSLVFIIDTGGDKTSSFSQTVTLPAGTELRVVPQIASNSLSGGSLSAYTTNTDSLYSFMVLRLIK
ncbi:hypothetical protein [Chryseobacterium sp.]|uniref:hypothetical protein n=1 Tax=Chryseobacterium sp. TaxID=1871047 RepID=UPI00388E333F